MNLKGLMAPRISLHYFLIVNDKKNNTKKIFYEINKMEKIKKAYQYNFFSVETESLNILFIKNRPIHTTNTSPKEFNIQFKFCGIAQLSISDLLSLTGNPPESP